ncbi:MAG: sulfur carrier protein ThiS [Nitrospiraceae bacterium]|nr:sulfur carrier protein ThiS [Nitrospiraceae bacterium]
MRLTINGETREDVAASTVAELLGELKIQPGRVAVEVNLTIVRKTDYGSFSLKDGDAVEIVSFVGGG